MSLQDPQPRYVLSLWKGRLDRAPEPLSPMHLIARRVADRHGFTVGDLAGPSKLRSIARARQEAMYELYRVRLADGRRRWSYPMIGRFLGGRDHTTIWFGVARHEARTRG